MTAEPLPRVNVLGIGVSALNMDTAVDHIRQWLSDKATGRYLCVTGVHGVMESLRNPEVRQAHNSASACVPDGMPMTWVGRLRGHRDMDRVYGPDLMLALLELSARGGFRNYFYGGAEGVADDLALRMTRRFPGLNVVGTHCPPFRPLTADERRNLVADVNRLQPDLMWVGLSTPKQELFMSEFHTMLECKVMIGVGAAFDFHTGRLRQAPRWMMRNGLEWFFRLCVEPRRLGPRYLRNNPAFVWHMFLQQTGIRRYPLT
jgi:N-acetylglucosaminyldiphosphoundecaprenol N-acetyl-beta-D-mannosaminyltransferase